jgi:NAD(P)-dependent dehydrogenase (short-subunit alcohol dehydrogenase family)
VVSPSPERSTDVTDPHDPHHRRPHAAYGRPQSLNRAPLNSFTIGLSKLLADTSIKANAVCPGFAQTI